MVMFSFSSQRSIFYEIVSFIFNFVCLLEKVCKYVIDECLCVGGCKVFTHVNLHSFAKKK